jgi:hypothetical protein
VSNPAGSNLDWRKSSFSGADGCLELKCVPGDQIVMRDSKRPRGSVLEFSRREWDAFVAGVKAGEFDDL